MSVDEGWGAAPVTPSVYRYTRTPQEDMRERAEAVEQIIVARTNAPTPDLDATYRALAESLGATLTINHDPPVDTFTPMPETRMGGEVFREILTTLQQNQINFMEEYHNGFNDPSDLLIPDTAVNRARLEAQAADVDRMARAARVEMVRPQWNPENINIDVTIDPEAAPNVTFTTGLDTGRVLTTHGRPIDTILRTAPNNDVFDTAVRHVQDLADARRNGVGINMTREQLNNEIDNFIDTPPRTTARMAGDIAGGIEPVFDLNYSARRWNANPCSEVSLESPEGPDYTLAKHRDKALEQLVTQDMNPNYVESVLNDVFSPLIAKTFKPPTVILSCTRERFIQKFGIISNILDVYDSIIEEIVSAQPSEDAREFLRDNLVLFGGKVVDFVCSKENGSNDFDIWVTNHTVGDADNFDPARLIPRSFNRISENQRFKEYEFQDHTIQIMDSLFTNGSNQSDVQVEDVLKAFDLRHCAIAADRHRIYWVKGALRDIINKRIVINKFNPSKTIGMRVAKYVGRGFSIALPDLLLTSIMQLSCVELDTSPFENQLYTERNYDATTLQELSTRLYSGI
jgi:hypothetical protein